MLKRKLAFVAAAATAATATAMMAGCSSFGTVNAQTTRPGAVAQSPTVIGTVVRVRALALPSLAVKSGEGVTNYSGSVEVAVKARDGNLYFPRVDGQHQPDIGSMVRLATSGNEVRIVD